MEQILIKKFCERFPQLAPITLKIKLVEDKNTKNFYVKVSQDDFGNSIINIYHPPLGFREILSQEKDIDPVISLLHEILHVLFKHISPPSWVLKSREDEEIWRLACEYSLQRYMLNKGVGQIFYEVSIAEVEEIIPELENLQELDLISIFALLKKNISKIKQEISIPKCYAITSIPPDLASNIEKLVSLGNDTILVNARKTWEKRPNLSWYINLARRVLDWANLLRYQFDEPSEETLWDERIVYPNVSARAIKVVILLDVSGSMNEEEIQEGVSYIYHSNEFEIEAIITHDDNILEVYNTPFQIRILKKGNMTSYKQVYNYVMEKCTPEALIIHITDGWCDTPVPETLENRLFFVFTKPTPEAQYLKYNHIFLLPEN